MSAYEKFLDNFWAAKDKILFVMQHLQNMAEAKKFEEFQSILDEADPEKFGDAALTIALVAWWYGGKVDRKKYVLKGIEYYDTLKGKGYGLKIFKGVMDGKWEPQFGFERDLFGISE